jgi:DNA-binding PadR family transcriptional regulator
VNVIWPEGGALYLKNGGTLKTDRGNKVGRKHTIMSDTIKLTPSLVSMLERIERHSGVLLLLSVTASGGREYSKLNKLRGAGYVVKRDHRSVTEGKWPAEALAITEAGRAALARHRSALADRKGPDRPGDGRVRLSRRQGLLPP